MPGGVTENRAMHSQLQGGGAAMGGLIPLDAPAENKAWLAHPWPYVCVYRNDAPKILEQAPKFAGRFPVAGTPLFDQHYGPNRWFIWCLYLDEWGLGAGSNPFAKANEAEARSYIAAFAERVRGIFRQCPRSVVLLPNTLPQLCGRWGVPATLFFPEPKSPETK